MQQPLRLLRDHPILFLIGLILTLVTTFAATGVIGYLIGLNPQMIGIGTGGVILFTLIPCTVGFVNLAEHWRAKHNVYLNSPRKRVIALLMPVGIALLPISWLSYRYASGGYLSLIFTPADWPYRDGGNLWSVILFWLGVVVFSAGLVFSYLYDSTLARVGRWIKGN